MKTGKYTIRWRHAVPDETGPGLTVCWVLINDEPHAGSVARCHPHDNFCKDTGRKVSLGKVMSAMALTKDERREIWEAYRTMTKNGRW